MRELLGFHEWLVECDDWGEMMRHTLRYLHVHQTGFSDYGLTSGPEAPIPSEFWEGSG